ncbi:hypothetical protein H6G01_24265 [Leptolyngbya sp. FACHB-17]|nr:hypothetical protein [Leptolyngbya sp. FACHB-17]
MKANFALSAASAIETGRQLSTSVWRLSMARYLSLNALLGVVTLSVLLTAFILINWVAPDLLFLFQ